MQAVSYNTFCLKRQQLMMDQALPDKFDVVVVGTGLEESILAAAIARVGHSVLHLDVNDYYGDSWAAFSFDGLQDWIGRQQQDEEESAKGRTEANDVKKTEILKEGEKWVAVGRAKSLFQNVRQEWNIPEDEATKEGGGTDASKGGNDVADQDSVSSGEEKPGGEEDQGPKEESGGEADGQGSPNTGQKQNDDGDPKAAKWTRKSIRDNSRRFNIDLTPRLLFSRGAMVELLISSNIARYTEFKSVSRVLAVVRDGAGGTSHLEHVPSSRADVFATRRISVVEKRILMKFLEFCSAAAEDGVASDQVAAFAGRPFVDFLRHHKLTPNLVRFVVSSIAMVPETSTTEEGLASTRKFLSSLGRFGTTPFLWSMYGSGELPQAFCRLCAVFGGTYYLGRTVEAVITSSEDNRAVAVVVAGARIDCDKLVLPSNLCPEEIGGGWETESTVGRRVALLAESMLPATREQLSFLSYPSGGSYAYVQEVGPGAAACPAGMYCLQCADGSGSGGGGGELDDLLASNSPLWQVTFDMEVHRRAGAKSPNVCLCAGPRFELDYDQTIAKARDSFERMFPGEEFLPRAPEPEEIIIGGGEEEGDQGPKSEAEEPKNETEEPKSEAELSQTEPELGENEGGVKSEHDEPGP